MFDGGDRWHYIFMISCSQLYDYGYENIGYEREEHMTAGRVPFNAVLKNSIKAILRASSAHPDWRA